MKLIRFLGDSKNRIAKFPPTAKRTAGAELFRVQIGEEPTNWKPMPSIGRGVREIRITDQAGAFRVIYVASIGELIYVLHAFQKKTQQTADSDIELAVIRYRHI
jgi:phage-related protein